jgi:putative endonuclease
MRRSKKKSEQGRWSRVLDWLRNPWGEWNRFWDSREGRRWLLAWRAKRGGAYDPWLRGITLSDMEKGYYGECLAAEWLKLVGRRVLFRNYKGQRHGEVDVVCRHGKELVFVEVKTREEPVRGRPADAVDWAKQRLIQRGATDWVKRLGSGAVVPIRFDIVEVVLKPGAIPLVSCMEDAFQLDERYLIGRISVRR